MAHTDITISSIAGVLTPSSYSVPVVDGDTVTFSTTDGSSVALFFSPAAVAVLSPTPMSPTRVAGSEAAAFTFTSSEQGAYSVMFGHHMGHPPFPTGVSGDLYINPSLLAPVEGIPTNPINTSGHSTTE